MPLGEDIQRGLGAVVGIVLAVVAVVLSLVFFSMFLAVVVAAAVVLALRFWWVARRMRRHAERGEGLVSYEVRDEHGRVIRRGHGVHSE